eukprot:CAMPEP_0116854158 /NCGR_PEP_ID=MMETSP0418-20121206/18407_1 /TAXON_ID=1158023 /ORGANISM="Astrosyne radiata, Strain 13vi08-1A" /LENGTH=74 /DNA_ID=CAMNT_0004486829 /DNA_START=122 /DNA_END=343 /DNA_ORIENTATION=-
MAGQKTNGDEGRGMYVVDCVYTPQWICFLFDMVPEVLGGVMLLQVGRQENARNCLLDASRRKYQKKEILWGRFW